MLMIGILNDDLAALDGPDGCPVRINGEPTRIRRVGNTLTWSDDDGTHVREILSADPTRMPSPDKPGIHEGIYFTCGEPGQRLEQIGPFVRFLDS